MSTVYFLKQLGDVISFLTHIRLFLMVVKNQETTALFEREKYFRK